MKCAKCGVDPFTYEGTGHRMIGYPYREVTVSEFTGCDCEAPTYKVDPPNPEMIAGYKAKLERRINAVVDNYIAKNADSIIDRWCKNDLDRVYWMTDEQWAYIEKERANEA